MKRFAAWTNASALIFEIGGVGALKIESPLRTGSFDFTPSLKRLVSGLAADVFSGAPKSTLTLHIE